MKYINNMKKTISCLIALIILCQLNNLNAQTNTQTATTYVGDQKNGQPDGMGVLTDTSGSVFKGSFKKGKKEGYGELSYKTIYDRDTTLVGYWKKDQYIGIYEYPYKIIEVIPFWKVLGSGRDTPGIKYLWNGNEYKYYDGINANKFDVHDFEKLIAKPYSELKK